MKRGKGIRQYPTIFTDLRGLIDSGEAPPGAKLPTEEDLAKRYGVSRDAVRHALAVLRNIGVVEARQGRGHFVVDRKPTTFDVLPADYQWAVRMPWPDEVDRLGLLKEGEPIIEIYRAGVLIEVRGTLHRTYERDPGESSPSMAPARPAAPS